MVLNSVLGNTLKRALSLFAPVQASPYQGAIPLAYRPDIDGLRAVAVCAVMLFHAFPHQVRSGFIGVDIFFVISGYLITSLLLQDIEQQKFSIVNFYKRRIRRIFPALIFVLATVLICGWFILIPDEYATLGKHVLGGAGFISNIILLGESGYFDTSSLYKILLHFWSLGIEEQFYIFFPVLLFWCSTRHIAALKIIILLFILSFADNIYLYQLDKATVFYSPLSRIWELLAGSLVSAVLRHPQAHRLYMQIDGVLARLGRQSVHDGHSLSAVLAVLGVIFLGVAFVYVEEVPWPGWMALLPVSGAAFLIAAGPANPFSKYILSNRLAVVIGLISYPLYLWHWPLLSYAAILGVMGSTMRVLLMGVAVLLAIFTYCCIERPVRFSRPAHTKALVISLFCTGMLLGVLGGIIWWAKGFPGRMPGVTDTTRIKTLTALMEKYEDNFVKTFPDWNFSYKRKMSKLSASLETTNVVIIGDSHADSLFPGLVHVLGTTKSVAVFSAPCAIPYLGISNFDGHEYKKYGHEMIQLGYDTVLSYENITNVILMHDPSCSFTSLSDLGDTSLQNRDVILEKGMRASFSALTNAHKHVLVVLDNPWLPFHPTLCVERPTQFFTPQHDCFFERKRFDTEPQLQWYKRILEKVVRDYPTIRVLDLSNYLCDEHFCYAKKEGKVFYHDKMHLSVEGSLFIAPEIAKRLR